MADKQRRALERVAGQRYWRVTEARVVVDAWRASGERLAAFARRYGIHARRVSRWARELEGRAEPVRFHPVQVVGQAGHVRREESRIEIELGDGARRCSIRRRHVELDAGELGLMLEGLDLRSARRRTRWYRHPSGRAALRGASV